MSAQSQLPKYQCHKKVWALQIASVDGGVLSFKERFAPIEVPMDMFARYKPVPGDYYVVYEEGYKSFSPKAVFEAGYSPL